MRSIKEMDKRLDERDKEIERLNNIIENLTTMTVNGDRTQIKNTAQYKLEQAEERIKKAINYIEQEKKKDEKDSFVDLYLDKYEEDLLEILKGDDK